MNFARAAVLVTTNMVIVLCVIIVQSYALCGHTTHHTPGLFLERNGYLFRFRKAIKAAKIFDPFVLAVLPLESLAVMTDELSHFQYPEFNQEFLDGMKKEVTSAVSNAYQIFDWDSVEVSDSYKTRIQKND